MICLDTTVLVDLLRSPKSRHREVAEARIRALSLRGEVLTTTRINVAELLVGVHRVANPSAERVRVERLLQPLPILEFDANSAEHFAMVKARLSAEGTPVGDADILIAAITQANGCSLLTRNPQDFSNVSGLTVESY